MPNETPSVRPRVNTTARSITAVIFALAAVVWIFLHPDRFWEGMTLGFIGAGVVGPELYEGARRLGR